MFLSSHLGSSQLLHAQQEQAQSWQMLPLCVNLNWMLWISLAASSWKTGELSNDDIKQEATMPQTPVATTPVLLCPLQGTKNHLHRPPALRRSTLNLPPLSPSSQKRTASADLWEEGLGYSWGNKNRDLVNRVWRYLIILGAPIKATVRRNNGGIQVICDKRERQCSSSNPQWRVQAP